MKFVVVVINGLEGLSSHTFVFGLEGLSPIGVWDVLGGRRHDGHALQKFYILATEHFVADP